MPGRPEDPRWAVFITCVVSHLPMIAVIELLARRGLRFESAVGTFAVGTSFMYHACECFGTSLFLSELKWHRLDNIGAITSVGCSCIHLACFENRAVLDLLQYTALFTVVVLQEAAPWDVRYTFWPVAVCIAVPIVAHVLRPRRRQALHLRRFFIGLGALLFAMVFFVIGLDDMHDPIRMFHGLFHVCIAVTIYFFFYAQRPPVERKRSPLHQPRLEEPVAVVVNL